MHSAAPLPPAPPMLIWKETLPEWKQAVRIVEGKNLGFLRLWKQRKHPQHSSLTCVCASARRRMCSFYINNPSVPSKITIKSYQASEKQYFFSGRIEAYILTPCFRFWKHGDGCPLACRDLPARGVGQKSDGHRRPSPPSLSRADFFVAGENFELFADLPALTERPQASSKRRSINKSAESRAEIVRLTAAGFTRLETAKRMGMAASTLYANFFSEIGGRSCRPGRRRHVPSEGTRNQVRALRHSGETLKRIAAAIGISEPTLRRAYAVELTARKD